MEGLEKVRPSLRLKVAGPFSEKVNHLFSSDEEGYELLGFVDNKKEFFRSIDLLVHPAKLEAFGMVITEALSSGLQVLCSRESGAAEVVCANAGSVLPENYHFKEWSLSANYLLNRPNQFTYSRSWHSCAEEYRKLYKTILL